nr:MAG: replication associated protein [Arizlama virus]
MSSEPLSVIPTVLPASLAYKSFQLGKNVCATVFKFDNAHPEHAVVFKPEIMDYLVYQMESAPGTGRHHLQLFCSFKKKGMYSKAIQTILGDNTAHLESMKGTYKEASDYCKKVESRVSGPWEYGVLPLGTGHGNTTSHEKLVDICKRIRLSEVTEEALAEECPTEVLHHYRAFQYLRGLSAVQRDPFLEPVVCVECGAPRAGKSRQARMDLLAMCPKKDWYEYAADGKGYWNRYTNQTKILFDEFKGSLMLQFFKQCIHAGRFTVPVKYGDKPFLADHIVFCSNYCPQQWYEEFSKADDLSLSMWGVFKQVRVWTRPYSVGEEASFRLFVKDVADVDGRLLRDAVVAFWSESGLPVLAHERMDSRKF